MAVIEINNVNGPAVGGIIPVAGVPSAGTSEVWTLTIGGTPTAGTFRVIFGGETSGAITWSATNNTLLSNINTALDAMNVFGAGDLVASDSSLTAGIGALLLTFSANRAKEAIASAITVSSALTGTDPTLAIEETTAGVTATARGMGKGVIATDTTNGILYINTGTAIAPTWTKVGTQS